MIFSTENHTGKNACSLTKAASRRMRENSIGTSFRHSSLGDENGMEWRMPESRGTTDHSRNSKPRTSPIAVSETRKKDSDAGGGTHVNVPPDLSCRARVCSTSENTTLDSELYVLSVWPSPETFLRWLTNSLVFLFVQRNILDPISTRVDATRLHRKELKCKSRFVHPAVGTS